MKTLLIASLGALGIFSQTAQAEIVYNNTSNRLGLSYGSPFEFGDQVILSGTSRMVSGFTFEYFGTNFSGNETAKVRFYKNDGPVSQNQATPGTLIWDSESFPIVATPEAGFTLTWDKASITFNSRPVVVPDTFTWTVEFGGITTGEFAGANLYSPPTVGNGFTSFWEKGPGGWELRRGTNPGGGVTNNFDFGAVLHADPVPLDSYRITQVNKLGSQIQLIWQSELGQEYVIQVSETLNPPFWKNIGTNVGTTAPALNFTTPRTNGISFYQIKKN